MNSIADIDQALKDAGLPEAVVVREAGLGESYLRLIRLGARQVTPRTARRLGLAIAEIKRRQKLTDSERKSDGRKPWESRCAAQYRLAVSLVAVAVKVSPRFILDADPARRATADPQWLRAAHLRRIALYIANQFLNVPQADLARAASMSKANVCVTLKDIEDARDTDDELARILDAVEEAFQ